MRKLALVILLSGSVVFAQTAPTDSKPLPPRHRRSAIMGDAASPDYLTPNVAPTAAIITIPGFCPKAAAGTDANSAGCKTVITKADFEKLVDALSPKMPGPTRENLANDYAKMLVLAHDAQKRGIENTERYKELLRFAALQLQSQELFHILQDESKPSDAEIEKYYQDHSSRYEEISVKRLFIPRNRADATGDTKMPSDEDMKAEGEKAKARLQGGEDFDKVQKEIYTSKGYNTPAPPTEISNWRVEALPPSEKPLANLKEGEFSPVMVEAAGAYIYRLDKKGVAALATVKASIEAELTKENFNNKINGLLASVKPELNQAYFHPPTVPAEGAATPAAKPDSHTVSAMDASESKTDSAKPAKPQK